MALAASFFAGAAIVLAQEARLNDRGLIPNGLIRFDMGDAAGFYRCFVVLSAAFVLAALLGVARAFGPLLPIVPDAAAIAAPTGLLAGTRRGCRSPASTRWS